MGDYSFPFREKGGRIIKIKRRQGPKGQKNNNKK